LITHRKSILTALLLGVCLVAPTSLLYAAKPQPPPPPPCTNCWNQATGLNGGVAQDLKWRYVLKTRTPVETVFAAVSGGTSPGLYQSTNGGESFSLVKALPGAHSVEIVQLSVSQNGRVWVAADQGLFYSDDLKKWTEATTGLPGSLMTFVGLTVTSQGLQLYTTRATNNLLVSSGLYRSNDMGATWQQVLRFANVVAVDSSLGCNSNPNLVFVAQRYSPGSFSGGVLLSYDFGTTWQGGADLDGLEAANDVLVDCGVSGNSDRVFATGDTMTIAPAWQNPQLGPTGWIPDFDLINYVDRASVFPNRDPGNIATRGAGIFTRICTSEALCNPTWAQYNTTGLGSLDLTDVVLAQDPTTLNYRYVATTPLANGVYYYEPAP